MQALALLAVLALIANLILFALNIISAALFWAIMAVIGIFAYKNKIKEKVGKRL